MPQLQTEISAEGLATALLKTTEGEKQHAEDLKVILWCHLLMWNLRDPERDLPVPKKNKKLPRTLMFKVMNSKVNRFLFAKGLRTFESDEVPTPWMRKIYQEFLDWRVAPDTVLVGQELRYMEDKSRAVGGEKASTPRGKGGSCVK